MAATRSKKTGRRCGLLHGSSAVSSLASCLVLAVIVVVCYGCCPAAAGEHIVIAPRHCHGSVRHLHLAVGSDPSPSRSMTVSFASTWAFPDRVAPLAGVFVAEKKTTRDERHKKHKEHKEGIDPADFLEGSVFYPEQEFPLTYEIYMQHKDPDSGSYYAPYQHHITIGGLEPDTSYYYLPVLGNREHGIEDLEEHARNHIARSSAHDRLHTQQQQEGNPQGNPQGNPLATNLKTETKLSEADVEWFLDHETKGTKETGNDKGTGDRRSLQQRRARQHFDYDEAFLARDYDTNTEIVEIPPGTPLWDGNGRRLSPPPYDPTGIACIDAGKIRSFRTAPEAKAHGEKPSENSSENSTENSTENSSENSNENSNENSTDGSSSVYPMTFGIIGDIGQFEHSREVLNHMRDHQQGTRAVVLVGDIAYPDYDGRKWDTFFDFLDDQSNFDEIPLMVAAGNHDIDKQYAGKQIFLGYEHRFRMPRLKPPELGVYDGDCEEGRMNMDAPPYPLPYEWGNSYYAFTYGPARHVVVNAYADMSPGSTQYEWLKAELASIDRAVTPWVLLTMHPPIYNTFSLHHHDPQIFAAKEHLEPLMVEFAVNVVLTGHVHAYQRTEYVAFGNLTDTGPVHITIGAGGRKADAPFTNQVPEDWIVVRDASMYGYGRLSIKNETHAEWRWIPIAPSELHDYNQVRGEEDLHLPSLDHDKVMIENQYQRRLRKLRTEGGRQEEQQQQE